MNWILTFMHIYVSSFPHYNAFWFALFTNYSFLKIYAFLYTLPLIRKICAHLGFFYIFCRSPSQNLEKHELQSTPIFQIIRSFGTCQLAGLNQHRNQTEFSCIPPSSSKSKHYLRNSKVTLEMLRSWQRQWIPFLSSTKVTSNGQHFWCSCLPHFLKQAVAVPLKPVTIIMLASI